MESFGSYKVVKGKGEDKMEQDFLVKVGGKLPSQDKELFSKILSLVIKNWELTKPADLMMANRMVATWMTLQSVEDKIEQKGTTYDFNGLMKINPLCDYARNLQNDLMRFYRLFHNSRKKDTAEPEDFSSWIKDVGQEKAEK